MKNTNWMFVAIMLGAAAAISWQLWHSHDSSSTELAIEKTVSNTIPPTTVLNRAPALSEKQPLTNGSEVEFGYQRSTNLDALPFKKRVFITNNFIPTANLFLKKFPTQHHPIEAKDIKAASVNYGVNGFVGVLTRIESDDGPFQIFTLTLDGVNHIQVYQDLTDFNIIDFGTANDLKAFPSGSAPSSITTASQAKDFLARILTENRFDFSKYLIPPTVVPYVAISNYGLWQVRYLPKNPEGNADCVEFVIDGTGQKGPFLRYVEQASTFSLPSQPQQ